MPRARLAPLLPMANRLQAIILDRDGVINVRRVAHVTRWEEFTFLAGATAAIARLSALQVPVYVITNQAIINRGIATNETVETIHHRMCAAITDAGGAIAGIVFCPHRPDEQCTCRKPAPGMLHMLAARHHLDLTRCLMVGDACTDLLAGRAAGCRTALVLTGQGYEEHARALSLGMHGFSVASSLSTLALWIERELTEPRIHPPVVPRPAMAEAAD